MGFDSPPGGGGPGTARKRLVPGRLTEVWLVSIGPGQDLKP